MSAPMQLRRLSRSTGRAPRYGADRVTSARGVSVKVCGASRASSRLGRLRRGRRGSIRETMWATACGIRPRASGGSACYRSATATRYPRVRNQGHVLVHGKRAPVIGVTRWTRPVDLTAIPEAAAWDEVVLMGGRVKSPHTTWRRGRARFLRVLTGWRSRLPRVYLDSAIPEDSIQAKPEPAGSIGV